MSSTSSEEPAATSISLEAIKMTIRHTLILPLHLIELSSCNTLKHLLKIRLPPVIPRRHLKALICLASPIIPALPLFIAQHGIREPNLLELDGRAGFDCITRRSVFVRVVNESMATI